ncbi:S53 family peptidase [Terriglobus aquaticus]
MLGSSVFAQTLTAWAPTATQALPLSTLVSATDLGPLPVSTPVTVRLGLAVQNKAALLSLVKAQSDPKSASYGKFLTPAQFATSFGAPAAQVSAVVQYLQSAGFGNIKVEPNNLIVSADGTAAQASAAFNTPLEKISQFGKQVYVNTSAAQVPASLGGIVTAVLGLNTAGQMKPNLALPSTPLPQYAVSYTPKQFQHLYSADYVAPANNATIAIMAEGDMTGVLSDLRLAEASFGLPQVPVEVVQVGLASPDVSGADEWDMDTQYSTGMAGNVSKLYLYATTSLSDSDLALEFSRWATDNKAKAASASLGECEAFPYLDGSMLVDDMIFLEAAAQGQTFFASSGDTGSFCSVGTPNGVPAGAPLVEYPAASPYVVGVGGTTLLANQNGNYNQEITWYAGGGGLSQFEGATFWQKAASPVLAQSNTRSVPDIALDADPYTGASVYVNGAAEGVGGTSLSSPLALGIWARAVSSNPNLGFAPIRLYSLYDGTGVTGAYPYGGFHDITVGSNGLYTALPGFDFTTGLGSVIVDQLTLALSR